LVEHLALDGLGVADQQHNGTTGTEHTFFHIQGTAEEVAGFLTAVCGALREPRVDRLAAARERLKAQDHGTDPLALWRHGARDFGLPGYPEWGLDGIGEEQLRDWIERYFTRENAALWIAGDDVPEGLKPHLPSGVRRPAPEPSSALPVTPAWFGGSDSDVAWDTVVRREARAAVLANVLERQMFREFRQRDGISYPVRTNYQPRSGGTARIVAIADALPEEREAVLGGLVDVLAALRAGRIDADDVATVITLTADGLAEADTRGGRLPGQAFNLLSGRAVTDLDEAVAEVRAVTTQDVAEVAAAAYDAGLLMAPAGTHADWAGYTAAPTHSGRAVTGRTHRAIRDPRQHLVAAADGVSHVSGDEAATVRYDECAALLAWPDGARQLIGADAIVVGVEPLVYRDAAAMAREVDARVPSELRVEMPARDPDRIPQPPPKPQRSGWERVQPYLGVFCYLPACVFLVGAALTVAGYAVAGRSLIGDDVKIDLCAAAVALVLTWLIGRTLPPDVRELRSRWANR
jgi:zinc protease